MGLSRHRPLEALLAAAIAAASALACGCIAVRSTTHYIDTPVSERFEEVFTGEWTYALRARRAPGAMVLEAERYRPCRTVLRAAVDRTVVTMREAPSFTGAYWFAGATLLGLGTAVAGISLARGGPGEAGDVVAGAAIGTAGLGALAIAAGYTFMARDRRSHLGPLELVTTTETRCAVSSAPALAVGLVDAAGTTILSGTTDAEGRLRVDDAAGAAAAGATAAGTVVTGLDLSGWRCAEPDRARLDALMAAADAALAPGLQPLGHVLAGGLTERTFDTPGEVHVIAVAASGAPPALESAAADTSLVTLRVAELAEAKGLTVVGRTRPAAGVDVLWSVRVRGTGCYLMLVYRTTASGAPAP